MNDVMAKENHTEDSDSLLAGEREQQIALYGAGMVAVSVYYAIKGLYKNCRIITFVVSEKKGNPEEIDGIPVISLEELGRTNIKILVAVPENHHTAIEEELKKRNLKDYVCINSKMEAGLMERYYGWMNYTGQTTEFPILHSYTKGVKKASLQVYMTKFYKDKPLQRKYEIPEWIRTIQAGAALTDIQISDVRDDTGDNISAKNVNYSELSAMYWVGKHETCRETGRTGEESSCETETYLGLFHYRRVLDVTEGDLYRISGHNIDVILPFPTIHYPSINEHHKRYLRDSDWAAMVQALEETAPGYAQRLEEIFSQPYFYNYNMFIARKHIFKEYCDWVFPILKRVEEVSVPKGSERADRYLGYLGESLTTLFFMYHRKSYKIAHTGRIMLV